MLEYKLHARDFEIKTSQKIINWINVIGGFKLDLILINLPSISVIFIYNEDFVILFASSSLVHLFIFLTSLFNFSLV